MDHETTDARLAFLENAGALKDVMRSGFTTAGRPEDTASHTWRLLLWIIVFEEDLPGADVLRMLKMGLIHDLGEAISGDIPAPEQTQDKTAEERADLCTLLGPLPAGLKTHLLALWDEYTEARTTEAQLVKGFDKLETILQHAQGTNPPDFDYGFNLTYARARTDAHPLLQHLRGHLDAKTRSRMTKDTT